MREAAQAAIAGPLTDDVSVGKALHEMIEIYLGGVDGSDD
jgi:nitric oxide reductase NorQ protein